MATPRRPDQAPQKPVPYAPGPRSGPASTFQLNTTGLALDTTVQAVNATLATPAQQATLVGLLTQIQQSGAQPWVPNMHSASSTLKNPGGSPYTIHTFTAASRIWGATVSAGVGTTAGSGTTNAYALVKTGGGVVLAIVEVCVAGGISSSSDSVPVSIPGIPVSNGDTIILDVNGGGGIGGGAMRASCSVLFSIP